MHPYEVFNYDEWEMIFEQMENPVDQLSLMHCHPALEDQFKPKEAELYFTAALPIILERLQDTENPLSDVTTRREIMQTCRLVSKKSCKVVDNWLKSHWDKNNLDWQPPSFLLKENDENQGLELTTPQEVDKFMKDFEFHPSEIRNPLLSRFVNVAVPMADREMEAAMRGKDIQYVLAREQEDNAKRIELLLKIGPHLRKLQMDFDAENLSPEVWRAHLNSLRNVLERTPNIKSMSFRFFPVVWMFPQGEYEPMTFPALPQLRHLSIFWMRNSVPLAALSPIQQYFPQLLHLEIEMFESWQDEWRKGLFPRLRRLELHNVEYYDPEQKDKLMNVFKRISAPNLVCINVRLITRRQLTKKELNKLKKSALSSLNKFHPNPECIFRWSCDTSRFACCKWLSFTRKL